MREGLHILDSPTVLIVLIHRMLHLLIKLLDGRALSVNSCQKRSTFGN